MSSLRVVLEVRGLGSVHRVEADVRSENWFNEDRNKAERRAGIITATNDLLRALGLEEIEAQA